MADVTKLKTLLDAYGVAVRAGCVTPCFEDEEFFRKTIGLVAPTEQIKKYWEEQGGIKRPLTIKQSEEIEGAGGDSEINQDDED